MALITFKAGDLKGERLILFPDFVSNGYWLANRARVTNARMLVDEETCRAFAPGVESVVVRGDNDETQGGRGVMPRGPLVEIRATGLQTVTTSRYRKTTTRVISIYHGEGVGFAGIDARYVALMGMTGESLWIRRTGPKDDDLSCAMDTQDRETATVAIMPCVIDDVRRWLRAPTPPLVDSNDTAAGMNDDAAVVL